MDAEALKFRVNVARYLSEIHSSVSEIENSIDELDCCILSNFEKLASLVADVQTISSSYYLKSYLEPYTHEFSDIAQAVDTLSAKRHGALIIVERSNPIEALINNGIQINAKVSQQLLEAIFYPGNPLHDGGTVILQDRILSAGNILPISNKPAKRKIGTRHRAAIGITEHTDALALIVSEETGRISFAYGGDLYVVKT
ncbi:hypothetical protein CVD25_19530 [Bacillus canaveralius]|uniref:Diadenylate cyclase n=1 Tax=Bacillus canaveralius TaxID=1403243 RepID=A0A2N5GIT7_9BACI|nr:MULTISPECIES: sporulation-specific diadenylate cyclase CdaS [Bacillus]PLR80895.1 hypothetical protein CU635_16645 [Bacillus canaveralius]PLR83380.1 hypothetical protein CVD23_14370 [Bacillus sp. V33-4]PLR91183.1 hypothetical protein CVD25_19530 [Bacillus canaveralius]RSK51739.1 diadenylate cyclase [Bacillus canaveralius]